MSCHLDPSSGVIRWYEDGDPQTNFDEQKPFKASANYLRLSPTSIFISNMISHDTNRMCPSDYLDLSKKLSAHGYEWVEYTKNGRRKVQHLATMDTFDLLDLIARA